MRVKTIRVSAPGKVMLAGEYAVLFGAPAIVAAADCRAVVSVYDAGASLLRTQGFEDGEWPFTRSAEGPVFRSANPPFPLFAAAVAECGLDRDVDIELDTRAFADPETKRKYGLGSSAALTVATVAALRAGMTESELLQTALAVHRRFQRGSGSGADIAAAVLGGVIDYRMNAVPTPVGWPAGLQARLFWSGQPASTTRQVAQLQASLDGATTDDALQNLSLAASEAAEAWQPGTAVMDAMRAYVDALRRFDDAHSLGIFAAGHDRLHAIAAERGLLYKPCGAGGGDIGVLLAAADSDTGEFDKLAKAQGFRSLGTTLGGRGVTAGIEHVDD